MRWLVILILLMGCGGVSSDPGFEAALRVENARFVPGKMPQGSAAGPAIVSQRLPHAQVMPEVRRERLSGTLSKDANAVLVGLANDAGYWILTAGVPTLEEPGFPTFSADLTFARSVHGKLKLTLAAVDRKGRVGALTEVALEAVDATSSAPLTVRLTWAENADLDLHLVTPDGSEVWAGDINSFKAPPPGSVPSDPDAWKTGAVLDFDSNGDCIIDGRREENIVSASEPAKGTYLVRVATPSLCAEAAAHWTVQVWLHGHKLHEARGTSVLSDRHTGRGAGTLALSFEVP